MSAIEIIDVVDASGRLTQAVDYLQRVIDCLEGGKETDLELDLSCAAECAGLAHSLIRTAYRKLEQN